MDSLELKHTWWKWLILVGALALSFSVVWPPKQKVRLGLDLQGGSSFTVQIDRERLRQELLTAEPDLSETDLNARVNDIMRDADARALEVLRNRIDGMGINEPVITAGRDHRILIQLPGTDETQRAQAEKSIQSAAYLEFRLVHRDNDALTQALFNRNLAPEGFDIVNIGQRRAYQRTADYEQRSQDPAYERRLSLFEVPDPGYAFMLERRTLQTGVEVYYPNFVERRARMTGENLDRASVALGPMGGSQVSLTFNAEGARQFARITEQYAPHGSRNQDNPQGRQLAVILDGTLYSAPVIRERIPTGQAVISGDFTPAQAALLRNILNAGTLPAPVRIIERRFVSPTLGQDAIDSGIRAIMIGGLIVIVFMVFYYRYCGLVADLALLLNMLLLPAGMILATGMLGIFARQGGGGGIVRLPVLTLPGIAGIMLTIGMAVDANVLIFERIREEMQAGKRLRSAILAAYDRAHVTIIDANLTTLLTALILFMFGSGPIRGFAITLSAGILASMFTALVVTKLVFTATISETATGVFRMLSIVKENIAIDFISKRRTALKLSGIVILITWAFFGFRLATAPDRVLGVDFTGGTTLSLSFAQRAPIADVRDALSELIADAHVQYQEDMDSDRAYLTVTTRQESEDDQHLGTAVQQTLADHLPTHAFRFVAEEEIGAQIGKELSRDAFWAILLALAGMILYISIRFEFGFSLGAIAALTHDVLVTAGIFVLLGRSISLPIVAALLTIVGYSINDTIVVFDRIREDLRLDQRRPFLEICNLSINQTLSRTVLTSLTTLIVLIALFIFGGGAINDFALAMIIGVLVGTYSSIFVATPVMLAYYRKNRPNFAVKNT